MEEKLLIAQLLTNSYDMSFIAIEPKMHVIHLEKQSFIV